LKNEELLDAVKEIIDANDAEVNGLWLALFEIREELAEWRGTVKEIQRHNGMALKILGGAIAALIPVIGSLIFIISQLM